MNESVKVYFGGDTSQLRQSFSEANKLAQEFHHSVQQAGLGAGRAFGFGYLIKEIKGYIVEVVDKAQKMRDEADKLGRPIDEATRKTAELGDAWDRAKHSVEEYAIAAIAGSEDTFVAVAKSIETLRRTLKQGVTEGGNPFEVWDEQAKQLDKDMATTEQSARDLAATLGRIAAAKKKFDDAHTPEAEAKAEKTALDDREKAWQAYLTEIAKKRKDASEDEKRRLDEEQKKMQEAWDMWFENEDIRKKKSDEATAAEEKRLAVIAKETMEKKKQAEIETELARLNKESYERTVAMLTLSGVHGDKLTGASDATLAEIRRRDNAKLQDLSGNPGSAFSFGNSLEITRLQNELSRVGGEENFRSGFRRTVQTQGVEAARRSFQGDPEQFDRVLQQLTSGLTVQDKQLTSLEKIRVQLAGKFTNQ